MGGREGEEQQSCAEEEEEEKEEEESRRRGSGGGGGEGGRREGEKAGAHGEGGDGGGLEGGLELCRHCPELRQDCAPPHPRHPIPRISTDTAPPAPESRACMMADGGGPCGWLEGEGAGPRKAVPQSRGLGRRYAAARRVR